MTDNGFLKLDNSIIDYWMAKLNHSELKTLLTIYRKTIGWNKQYDRISQNQIADLSGITTRSVRSAIASLEELGLIITTGKNKSTKVFTLDTNNLFNVCLKSDEIIEMESKLSGLEINSNNQCSEGNNNEISFLDDADNCLHKRHSEYTNNIKVKEPVSLNIAFDLFWDLYDYKKNKADCNNKWLSMTDEERQLTMDNLALYIKSTPDKTFRKYPINYLNNEMWYDEVILPSDNKDSTSNTPNTYQNNSSVRYSASFKPFDNTVHNHTKDDEECNLEALGLSSGKSTDMTDYSNDCTNNTNNSILSKINTPEDILSKASQTHWSELKSKGLLKKKVNPDVLASNTDADSKVNEFLARHSSKRFCKDIA